MSESEKSLQDFLQRWSRRKLSLEDRASEPSQAPAASEKATMGGALGPPNDASGASTDSVVESFDLAHLPPIESIDASTDVRAFLASGVPTDLTRAALRRAWVSDPAIRDFIGLAENQCDFTNPEGVPGFGSLELTPELRRLVAGLFGESPPKDADAFHNATTTDAIAAESAKMRSSAAPTSSLPDLPNVETVVDASAVCLGAALQSHSTVDEREQTQVRPKHGGALPR